MPKPGLRKRHRISWQVFCNSSLVWDEIFCLDSAIERRLLLLTLDLENLRKISLEVDGNLRVAHFPRAMPCFSSKKSPAKKKTLLRDHGD